MKAEQHEEGRALQAVIGEQVLHQLGKPTNLQRLQVRPLWQGYFRVNVLIGPDPLSVTVAASFFLRVDTEGNIVSATPKITRRFAIA